MQYAPARNLPQVAPQARIAKKPPEVEYILGHSPAEMRRLMLQASLLEPITARLLREAGIAPGMRVLDIGCGSGDVALLASRMVGPRGAVVGIDRNADVLALARSRALAAGHDNVAFLRGSAEDMIDAEPFDLAIGRYVLMHQRDPVALIRATAAQVRPGGVVAFHEVALYEEYIALTPVPLWQETAKLVMAAFKSVMAYPDAAGRISAFFHAAGLRPPAMFCEALVGSDPDSPVYSWIAQTMQSVLPQIEKIGAATAEEIDIDTLEQRLRDAGKADHSQFLSPLQFCGWAKVA